MRKSLLINACLLVSIAPFIAACDDPHYVYNNGVKYYDANEVATDTLPSGPYTKGGQYLNNPDEATNTRDNRGNRPTGYGHDVNDDYRQNYYPAPGSRVIYPAGTVICGDGTAVYPDGTVVYPGAPVTTSTTVIQHNW